MAYISGIIDLHMHSTVSDGTDAPEALPGIMRSAGIALFSVTDHDAIKTAGMIRGALTDGDPAFIPGVEFSCGDGNGKYHILGYGFDPDDKAIRRVVDYGHNIRMGKVRERLGMLDAMFGIRFPGRDVNELLHLDNPGKPHIANLLIKYGYSGSIREAMREYIDPLRITEAHVSPKEAIAGIAAAGGVAVLAHPFFGSGDELIIGDEMDKRLARLKGYGLEGIEAYYSGFSSKLINEALYLADRYDLLITAGSDYHGSNKLVKPADTGLTPGVAYPPGLIRFLHRFGFEVK